MFARLLRRLKVRARNISHSFVDVLLSTGMSESLRCQRRRAVVVIATDGESSDGDLAAAMAPLRGLPVRVVIRLFTDCENIRSYWNNIDKQLGA
jgi:hypothetical protein